jgi:hypothetical protein
MQWHVAAARRHSLEDLLYDGTVLSNHDARNAIAAAVQQWKRFGIDAGNFQRKAVMIWSSSATLT